jgi:hypothetical protein
MVSPLAYPLLRQCLVPNDCFLPIAACHDWQQSTPQQHFLNDYPPTTLKSIPTPRDDWTPVSNNLNRRRTHRRGQPGFGAPSVTLTRKQEPHATVPICYEQGITHINGATKDYVPFAEIEDLYLFSSGQTAISGLITNLAYRRDANEPFHRVIESLKGFQDFQQKVRELHVRARLPVVLDTLAAGGSVTFKYLESGAVWGKRMSGKFRSELACAERAGTECIQVVPVIVDVFRGQARSHRDRW